MFQPKSDLLWREKGLAHTMSTQNTLSAMLNTEHTGMLKTKVPLPPKFPFLKTFFPHSFFSHNTRV